jgi:hypothetical protein
MAGETASPVGVQVRGASAEVEKRIQETTGALETWFSVSTHGVSRLT